MIHRPTIDQQRALSWQWIVTCRCGYQQTCPNGALANTVAEEHRQAP